MGIAIYNIFRLLEKNDERFNEQDDFLEPTKKMSGLKTRHPISWEDSYF